MKHIEAFVYSYHYKYTGEIPEEWGAKLPPCAVEPRPEYVGTGYFESRSVFDFYLKKWSSIGWSYYETPEDMEKNGRAPTVTVGLPQTREECVQTTKPLRTAEGQFPIIESKEEA